MTAENDYESHRGEEVRYEGERVAILDAGAQYLKLIDARVRELGVYTEILPLDTPVEQLQFYKAVIISGGPASVNEKSAPHCDPNLFKTFNKPVLGICYGMQEITYALNGSIKTLGKR